MAKDVRSINLFKKEEKNVLEKFLDWALTIGRILVIVTEAIALSAFLYRFTLDMQLVDLHDKIKNQQIILKSLEQDEIRFRDLQDRLLASKTYGESAGDTKQLLDDLITAAQGNVVYNTVTIQTDSIRADADATSVPALSRFVNALRAHRDLESISIDKIENKTTEAIISVSVTAKLIKPLVVLPKERTVPTE